MNDQPFDDNINIPEPYLIAIGKVNVVWGMLESVVDLAIAKLSGLTIYDPRSAIITAHMTWPLKMDILESLATALKGDYPHLGPKMETAKPLLKKAQEGRNRTAHGQWSLKEGQVVKLRYTARGKLKSSMDPVNLSDLTATVEDIWRAGDAVMKLILGK